MRVDPKWIRNPSDSLAVREGCTFDEDPGAFVCEFIETFCRQSKGSQWAGQPMTLLDWQRDFLMRLFGWRRPDGRRRFTKAYLEVAKKNGKSTLVSALVLVLLLCDDAGPEVYLNACDREQASIVFTEAKRMIEASPELMRRLKILDSKADKRILWEEGNGSIIANSSVAASKDGLNPSGTIFDELHRQKGRELWSVFEYAGAGRREPLRISITTAGEEEEGPWFEERELSEKVNSGAVPDTTHLGVVYRLDPKDDLDAEANWYKANPSLGITIDLETFRREWESAKRDPLKRNNFLRLRFNIVARAAEKAIPMAAWDACPEPASDEDLDGEPCYMGLDLSDNNDLASLVSLYGDVDAGFDLRAEFWLPEENIADLERQHGVPYRAWADMGLITLTPGNVIDYGFIRAAIVARSERCRLVMLGADPFHAGKLAQELQDDDGLPVTFVRQGFLTLGPATKELDRLTRGGLLRHGGHPILKWHASNAIAVSDDAGSRKLSKRKSKKKIDGMSALVNAIAVYLGEPDVDATDPGAPITFFDLD